MGCFVQVGIAEPFEVELDIELEETCVHTSYGVVKLDSQTAEDFVDMAELCALHLVKRAGTEGQFFLQFLK